MKKLLLVFLGLLYSSVLFAAIDERKTDVYFANGILTDEGNATANAALLEETIKSTLYGSLQEYNLHIGTVTTAYNNTNGQTLDILESIAQKLEGNFLSIDLISLLDRLATILTARSHDSDLELQIEHYKDSIQAGHKVLAVAHSQGNLFTYEAYRGLDKWMQNYFEAISIASPGHELIKEGTPRISWDNDLVAYLGLYDDFMPNSVRKVNWVLQNSPVEHSIGKPLESYVYKSQLGDTYTNGTYDYKAEEGFFGRFDSNVHAFTFYMGEELRENGGRTILNPLDQNILVDTSARSVILPAIASKLRTLEEKPSQWEKLRETGTCVRQGCGRRLFVKHKFDEALDKEMSKVKVYPFNEEEGKIYAIDGKYVKGNPAGKRIIDRSKEPGIVCYELEATDEKMEKVLVPQPEHGVVEVSLIWEDSDIDLNLEVDWLAGFHDLKDNGCPREHFYIESQDLIYPGRYPVNVTVAETMEPELLKTLLPEKMHLFVTAPGEFEQYELEIKTADMIDLGHVADIKVTVVDNAPVVEPEIVGSNDVSFDYVSGNSSSSGGHGGGNGGGKAGSSGSGTRKSIDYESATCKTFDCGCLPCEYEVIPYLEQALLGPLAGADVTLHVASQYGNSAPIYTGQTSDGETLYDAGLIDLDNAFKEGLVDDELYIFTVSGGRDIDANDDMEADAFSTVNRGSIHAVMTGAEIKAVGFKVNILTEIAYQITKEMYGSATTEQIIETLDEVATLLLREKVYRDVNLPLGHADLAVWLPTVDQKLLFVDYTDSIQPLIDDIYYDLDIYQKAYDVVYETGSTPKLVSAIFTVDEQAPAGTHVGNVTVVDPGSSEVLSMTLEGENHEAFTIDPDGNVYVAAGAELDFETEDVYTLEVRATNSFGNSQGVEVYVVLNDIVDVPAIRGLSINATFDNALPGSEVGRLTIEPGLEPTFSVTLDGNGSDYFRVDSEGVITVGPKGFDGLDANRSDTRDSTIFSLYATAANGLGTSRPARIAFEVFHVQQKPAILPFTADVLEHAAEGSIVGTLHYETGVAPVSSFTLVGEESASFEIDTSGTLRIKADAALDYERKSFYDFDVYASSVYGDSAYAHVRINVINEADIPELSNTKLFSVDENATSDTVVGHVVSSVGTSAISELVLESSIYPYDINTVLTVDHNGTLRVKAGDVLDYETQEYFHFTVHAANSEGNVTQRYVLRVLNAPDVPEFVTTPIEVFEAAAPGSIVGNILSRSGGSAITSLELEANENFTVDLDGNLIIKEGAALDFETRRGYGLYATAVNGDGSSRGFLRIFILDSVDVPFITGDHEFSVDENALTGSVVGSLEIVSGATPTASVVLSGSGSEHFTVDVNGTITVSPAGVIDYEMREFYSLIAIAKNQEGNSTPFHLQIHVNNLSDVADVKEFGAQISEDSPSGTIVGSVLFTDEASLVTHFILSGAGSDNFDLDASGKLTVREGASLDYESRSYYTLSAVAVNDFGSSLPVGVFIEILDVEDAPKIEPLSASVDENALLGTVVGHIPYAQGGEPIVGFTLSGAGNEIFQIDSNGTLFVAATPLDFEQRSHYDFTVTVFSASGQTAASDLNISINDRIDQTVLRGFDTSLVESSSYGRAVGTLEVVTYGDAAVEHFKIEGDGAESFVVDTDFVLSLRSDQTLDYERQQEYHLSITGVTSQGDIAPVTVNIEVEDVLDAPTYIDATMSVKENSRPGTVVGQLQTLPLKDTEALSMELSGNGSEMFSIDQNGVIRVVSILDFETRSHYDLQARAQTIYGTSQAVNVVIVVEDVPEDGSVGLGRIGGADVKLFKVEDNGTTTLLYTEVTSDGDGLYGKGHFNTHRDTLDSEAFYLYTVSGGTEYDVDNDGVLDVNGTPNLGTFHAIVQGEWLYDTQDALHINLMTEVFYQQVRELLAQETVGEGDNVQNSLSVVELELTSFYNDISDGGSGKDALTQSLEWSYRFPQRLQDRLIETLLQGSDTYETVVSNSFLDSSWPTMGYDRYDVITLDATTLAYVDVSGAYEGESTSGLWTIDVSDPFAVERTRVLDIDAKAMAYSASRQILATVTVGYDDASAKEQQRLELYDRASGFALLGSYVLPIGVNVNHLEISSDGMTLFFGRNDALRNGIGVVDIQVPSAMIETGFVETPGSVTEFTLSADGNTLFVADGNAGVQVIDIASLAIVGNYLPNGLSESVILSSDGFTLYTVVNRPVTDYNSGTGGLGSVHVVSVSDIHNVFFARDVVFGEVPLSSLAFTEDETQLVAAITFPEYKEVVRENPLKSRTSFVLETPSTYYGSAGYVRFLDATTLIRVTGYEVYILDISDPDNPIELSHLSLNSLPG